MDAWILTLLTFLPLLGAGIILLLPSRRLNPIRWTLPGHDGGLPDSGGLAVCDL